MTIKGGEVQHEKGYKKVWWVSLEKNVEDKLFTPHGFISLETCTTSTLSWILGKSLLKPKKALKPMVQGHDTSPHFLAHDPSSWVLLGEFWESWFGGPRSMFSKDPMVQSW